MYENNPAIKAFANSKGAVPNGAILKELADASVLSWTTKDTNQKYYESFWNNSNSYFGGKWWRDTELMSIAGLMLQAEAKANGGISIQSIIDMTSDKGRNEKISALQRLMYEDVTGKWNAYTVSGLLYQLSLDGF